MDSALLWHCRLGHISKKRIEKLQHDGLLNSSDLRAFEKCVSCMSGKMARKPYTHQVERAKDLLGLIHTDVCGPFKIMSRQGASYFVTFTDDFSRYGYVYLLKHKHEVFETFKVFQKEVENQLGKTIKLLRSDRGGEYMSQEFLDHLKDHGIIAHRTLLTLHNIMVFLKEVENQLGKSIKLLRSDRGGEYMSQEFLDHLKEHGIIAHRTPPYTLQNNRLSEKKNRTLLDMNVEFFESKLLDLKASGSVEDLELIQKEDTNPFVDISLNHEEGDQEINEPYTHINPICESSRTRRASNRMCLYIDAKEHELRDLDEPANYKAALQDPKSKKWLDAMNMITSSANNLVFRGFFEKQKLTGPNFIDGYRQLRIVLSIEDKLNYLEQPIPLAPVAPAGQHVAAAHTAWLKGSKDIAVLMLMTMEPEIQQNLENLHAHEMLSELNTLFARQAEHELLQTTRDFHSCKQEEGQSVSSYVLKMKCYIYNLERLGHPVTLGLSVSLILIGLRKEYDGFVQNYNIHSMGKTINELHAMLKLHEQTLPKNNAPALHAIRASKVQKVNKHKKPQPKMAAWGQNHGKGKNKLAYAPKPKIPLPPKREDPTKDSIYHESLGAGGLAIFVIELNTILNRSWIYDTGCGTHICNTMQGLRASRKLKPGALSLYVGNGQREAVEAIGVFYLCLPSGLEIVLKYCHFASYITRGVIFVSRLYEDGFINCFVNNTIQVSRNNMVYFSAIPRDGIFEIDLSNSYTNESSIYAVSNKRAKLDLDSALLWHCRLRNISKKRIEKLQHDGLLNSTNLRDFENVSLHKHDVFETFKVFQKEVENQLGKTIKSLRSDHEGEYTSQVFLDHLKDHGIIAHRTPPYTLQHNGYPKETMDYSFYYPPENKVLIARNAECLENSLITQEASGSLEDLEIIQEEDTHPSIDTSLYHEKDDQETNEPHSDINPIRRSTRTRHALDRMRLYIDAEEHELGDLGEPANYKAALLDLESEKWLNAMNVEMQSMKDNEVWVLVELPPNGKTYGSKWIFKKKTDMDGVSAKQSIFATSSVEAEYIAAFDASKEAVWVRKFISGLGVVPKIEEPISMYCDNTGAIAIANES
uniref:Zinc finger, CCHC-type n=1 Tax=Tanacetum cinerariifolium TaxID=118510 RepID=A0A6L2JI20_TANCI|nr:zinc finger, CCHC-type [Tanacetum cinerariifolium]